MHTGRPALSCGKPSCGSWPLCNVSRQDATIQTEEEFSIMAVCLECWIVQCEVLRRVHDATLPDKVRSWEIRKVMNAESLLRTEGSQMTGMHQERLTMRALLATRAGKWPIGRPRWLHIWLGLVPLLCGASKTVGYFKTSWGCFSATLPGTKSCVKRDWGDLLFKTSKYI